MTTTQHPMIRSFFLLALLTTAVFGLSAGGTSDAGDILSVRIVPGTYYRHELRISSLVTLNNPPQMAIWTETPDGRYRETIFVTRKTADGSWRRAPGDNTDTIVRPESLPVWTARSRDDSAAVDGVSGASRKKEFTVGTNSTPGEAVIVYMEVNHSTDFNEVYGDHLPVDSPYYNGGSWGSGQPSLIYSAEITVFDDSEVPMTLTGHGSPDGSDGEIHSDLGGITTALDIVDVAVVEVGF